MAKAKKSETVPKAMQEKFDQLVALTDEFSRQHLNEEYASCQVFPKEDLSLR
ncbi:MAG: hypothetical protein HC921_17520 [Synechococcaceae cyanobacterium SM2_3_1]|nr:hypothetical protein [Synechococcaceae cyanobacterium SM2_3_1]